MKSTEVSTITTVKPMFWHLATTQNAGAKKMTPLELFTPATTPIPTLVEVWCTHAREQKSVMWNGNWICSMIITRMKPQFNGTGLWFFWLLEATTFVLFEAMIGLIFSNAAFCGSRAVKVKAIIKWPTGLQLKVASKVWCSKSLCALPKHELFALWDTLKWCNPKAAAGIVALT